MKRLILIIIFLISIQETNAQISVGETAPDFSLPELGTGQTITLSDFSDKVVYIFFYGANCPHCRTNGPVTESQIFQQYKDNDNFVAFGLDTWNQNASSNNSFRNVTGITYPLLLNARDILSAYYGNTSSYDRSVVVGPGTILRYRGQFFVNTDVNEVRAVIDAQLETLQTSSEFDDDTPTELSLDQNYPNPFNPETTITFSLEETTEVELTVFNIIGQPIATLADGLFLSGAHSVRWDASPFPSGVYLYQLTTSQQTLSKRMLLLK